MKYIENGFDIQIFNNCLYFQSGYSYNDTDKYYKYDLNKVHTIERDEYIFAKYRRYSKKIFELFECEPKSIIHKPDSIITTTYQSSVIFILDNEGNIKNEIDNIGFDSIYGIAFEEPDYLWCAFPTANAIRKYRLSDSKELFGIGSYDDNSILEYPENVEIYGNYLYISDLRHCRICRLNLQTYQIETYWQFDNGGPYAYKRIGNLEFAELYDGIYERVIPF